MIRQSASVSANGGVVLETSAASMARASRLWMRADVAGSFVVTCAPSRDDSDLEITLTTQAATAGLVYAYTIDGPAGYLRVKFTPTTGAQVNAFVALETAP